MKVNRKSVESLTSKLGALYVELTTQCNLLCRYCYNMSANNSKPAEIDKNLLFDVLQKARLNEETNILILSGGEPLLYPYIVDVCSFAHSIGYNIRINTNGTLLSREFLHDVMPYKPYFQITLDSYDEQINDFYKGAWSYRKILNGLQLLATEYNMEHVVVRCNLTNEFIDDEQAIENYVNLLKRFDVHNIYFSLIMKQGRALGQSYPSRETEMTRLVEFKNRVKSLSSNREKNMHIEVGYGICLSCPYISRAEYAGKYTLHVTPVGDVYPCNSLAYNLKYKLGNLNDSSISEIFLGETMTSVIEKLERKTDKMKKCEICNYRHFCGKGCAAEKEKLTDEAVMDNECNFRRKEMSRIIRGKMLVK